LFKVFVGYPSYEQEYDIAERTTAEIEGSVSKVLTGEQIAEFQRIVRRVPAAPDVIRHALDLARLTRPSEPEAPEFVRKMLTWGAGPRAVQALVLGGKARAALHGRYHLSVEDVRSLAHPVLRHRIVTNYSARAADYDADRVVDELVKTVQPGRAGVEDDKQLRRVVAEDGSEK
jgi:MoxR-like ATPase